MARNPTKLGPNALWYRRRSQSQFVPAGAMSVWVNTSSMNRYVGPAVLVANGVLVSVDLDVRTYESVVGARVRRSWSGTAQVTDGASLSDQAGHTVTIELPAGIEARAVIGAATGSPTGEVVAIRGTGEPPY